jgi:hypothetical protein
MVSLLARFAAGASEPDDELKAATVLGFIRHSEFPGSAVGTITVGIVGRPAMARTLRRALTGKTGNNRAILVLEAATEAELQRCQVVYVATDKNSELRQTLTGLRGSQTLTIGEANRFLEYGGAVSLLFVDGHMSFEVNLDALSRAGVNISSTLLRYGQVKARPPR